MGVEPSLHLRVPRGPFVLTDGARWGANCTLFWAHLPVPLESGVHSQIQLEVNPSVVVFV